MLPKKLGFTFCKMLENFPFLPFAKKDGKMLCVTNSMVGIKKHNFTLNQVCVSCFKKSYSKRIRDEK